MNTYRVSVLHRKVFKLIPLFMHESAADFQLAASFDVRARDPEQAAEQAFELTANSIDSPWYENPIMRCPAEGSKRCTMPNDIITMHQVIKDTDPIPTPADNPIWCFVEAVGFTVYDMRPLSWLDHLIYTGGKSHR